MDVIREESFREKIARHRDAGTCYICEKPVESGQAYHGATGAHWDCNEREDAATAEAFARVDEFWGTNHKKRDRCREGDGKTAQRAKSLAITAVELALGAELFDVRAWNQQGIYRGPRWDLDSWGLHFKFRRDGHEFSGQASSLATMTQCVKWGKLLAIPDDISFSYSLSQG